MSFRYLGIHIDSKLTFEAHLIVVLKNGDRHSLTISGKKPYTFGSKAAIFQIFSPVSFVIQCSLFTNIVSKKNSADKSRDYLGHKSVLNLIIVVVSFSNRIS